MKILFAGDVVGKSGRKVIQEKLPELRRKLKLDFIVVNGENAAGGFGLTKRICDEFLEAGTDVVTGGDHVFDQREVLSFIGNYTRLLRPHNFPRHTPGTGVRLYKGPAGERVLVIHLLGQVFIKMSLSCPFECVDNLLKDYTLGKTVNTIIVDFHCEATSESMAMGHFLDGRVSFVCGSHTHVPTADTMILPGGTAYQSDAGMCGDYNSIIGFDKDIPLATFFNKYKTERMVPAKNDATLCGLYVETDNSTGLAKKAVPIRIGGVLAESLP